MSNDQNKDIAHRFIQAWNAGGQGVLDDLAAPDITVHYSHFPEPVRGLEGFKQILAQTFASKPVADWRSTRGLAIRFANGIIHSQAGAGGKSCLLLPVYSLKLHISAAGGKGGK